MAEPTRGPRVSTLAQYVKDLSFENPRAPRSLQPMADGVSPQIEIQVNVNGQPLGGDDHEVVLTLEGTAKAGGEVLFAFSLAYGCVLRLQDVPADQVHPAVMIEGPRLLFPFARQVVAEAVRGGGFPPLYIDPIDFHGLYVRNAQDRVAGA